ncbi:MAG TPA: TniQ family protein [Xanthomonadaceae bacterium]|jgi:hypothetical protein
MKAMPQAVRWWIAPPEPDESIGSWVARAAVFFERHPLALWADLLGIPDGRAVDMDDPPAWALVRLARATGMSPRQLYTHRLADAPWLLAQHARRVYCPSCLSERGGEVLVRQRKWFGCLRTACPTHRVPLLAWEERKAPIPWSTDYLGPAEQAILDLIERVGSTLEDCLTGQAEWPSDWRGDALAARTTLLRLCINYGAWRSHAGVADVLAPPLLRGLIHGPTHRMDPRRKPIWDDFRAIVDPAVRRAALWVVAWKVIPGLGNRFRPGWFIAEPDNVPSEREVAVP